MKRLIPAAVSIALFTAATALYASGHVANYRSLLVFWGVAVWSTPFLDTDTVLSAVRCLSQGVDVYVANPCDPLQRPFDYSPLWMILTTVPKSGWMVVPIGLAVDAAFLASLLLLPPGRSGREATFITLAAVSSASAFAVERGNNDLVLFVLAAGAAALLARSQGARLVGYTLLLIAGLLKYYPLATMATALRERPAGFVMITAASIAATGLFAAITWADLSRALALIPVGSFAGDMFGSIEVGGGLTRKLHLPAVSATIIRALMSIAALVVAIRLALRRDTQEALAALSESERNFLMVGALLIIGCFFTAQNIGYRAVHLVLTMPALAVLWRVGHGRFRALAPVTLLLLWAQAWRGAAERFGTYLGGKNHSRAVWGTWAIREPLWWFLIVILLSLVIAYLLATPSARALLKRRERAGPGS